MFQCAHNYVHSFDSLYQAPARKPRCAVIDDDTAYLQLIRMYQYRLGLEVSTYEHILTLGRISQLTRFDIVVLDYNMPGLTGLEISQCANSLFGYLPIVLVTGCDSSEIPWASVGSNVRAVVSKSEGVPRVCEALWGVLSGLGWEKDPFPEPSS